MGNPLAQLMAMLQGSPMSRLPSEPQGVRPGFGLRGAGVQPSDLMDKLRNADRKDAAMPMTPGGGAAGLADDGMLSQWMRVAANKGLTPEQAMKGAQIVMDDAEYYSRVGFNGVLNEVAGGVSGGRSPYISLDPTKMFTSKY